MFGQWPHDLLAVSSSEYRRLQRYYFAVKDAQKPNSGDSDLPDGVEVIE